MIKDRITDALIDKWGTVKFVKLASLGVIGGALTIIIAEPCIPNEPKTTEKEND